MSYSIVFKVKVQNTDLYLAVGQQTANVTWNLREMICKSTGLPWENCEDNGLVKDVIPHIEHGIRELEANRSEYKQYESPNGWGTVIGCLSFFYAILQDWEELQSFYPELTDVVHFWIE